MAMTILMYAQIHVLMLISILSGFAQERPVSGKIFFKSTLAEGFDMGVDTSGGMTNWVKSEGDYIIMSYPAGQKWGAVFITVGEPKDPPRPHMDFSRFRVLSVEMKGQSGGERVEIGIKSNEQQDNGKETKKTVELSNKWVTYSFPLSEFTGARLDRLYVVTEFVFVGNTPRTVYFRNIEYLADVSSSQGKPAPKGQPDNAGQPDNVRPSNISQASPQNRAATQKRYALVIGNSDYANSPLRNPVNDARDMANTLRALGFEVIEGLDKNKEDMTKLIRDFGNKLKQGNTGLFYFAGHGIQVNGENYLIPVKNSIEKEQDIENESVSVGRVFAEMDAAQNEVNIIILDACRNNPFERSFRGVERGLAVMKKAPSQAIIAYATAPNEVASDLSVDENGMIDPNGNNGLYTGELLKNIQTCTRIEDVFQRVRKSVSSKSGGKQVPWESTSLTSTFYFCSDSGPCIAKQPKGDRSFSVDAIYTPSGVMGDIGDVQIAPKSQSTEFVYRTEGRGPHEWNYKYIDGRLNPNPAKFGGAFYLNPPDNFGTVCGGYDLRNFRRAIKWEARSLEGEVEVEFIAGGITWVWNEETKRQIPSKFPDSMERKSLGIKRLKKEWQTFEADLSEKGEEEFTRVVGAFAWSINWASNGVRLNSSGTGPDRARTFRIEVRNIRYEGSTSLQSIEQPIFKGEPAITVNELVLSKGNPLWLGLPVPRGSRIAVRAIDPANQKPIERPITVELVNREESKLQFWKLTPGNNWDRREPVDLIVEAFSGSKPVLLSQATAISDIGYETRNFILAASQAENTIVIPTTFYPKKETIGFIYYLPQDACVMAVVRDSRNRIIQEWGWVSKRRDPHFIRWDGRDGKKDVVANGVYNVAIRYVYSPPETCATLKPDRNPSIIKGIFKVIP